MKIYKNSISDDLLTECVQKVKENITKENWRSSSICWSEEIKRNISGSCIFSQIDSDLSDKLEKELNKYFPEYNEIFFQYYIWQHNAGISIHADKPYKFGATLYLNTEWHVNWGGLFIWYNSLEDSYEGEAHCLVPRGKTLVINDEKQLHLVTPVSATSPELRVTIQIWGR
jgi:hypothetical protein